MASPRTPALARWQLAKPGTAVRLGRYDAGEKPFSSGDKAADKAQADALALEIDQLQDMLFADRRFKVLVVLQGMDGSGKDGTIRGVFGRVSPLGVHTRSWRAPTEEERAHDFLWRIHHRVPAAGELMIFNRSHYEDVLVPMAEFGMKKADALVRCRQINDFERMLTETGTVILKFMLLISKEEQRERLQARLDDASKAWKFAAHDLEVRKLWDRYRKAYEVVLSQTGTSHAPWTVVPADSKTHRNVMIGTLVRDRLAGLKLRYPPPDPALAGLQVK
jgi:PPK2 family polyphosphate:nucleotide phosphotransferase